jgi:TolA-binding protein
VSDPERCLGTRAALAAAVVALLVAGAGCTGPLTASGGPEDASEIRDQLFKLQQDTAKIISEIEAIKAEEDGGEEGETSTARETCARAATRVAALEEQIQQLQTLLSEDRSRIEDLAQMLRSLRAGTDIPSWSDPERLEEVTGPRAAGETAEGEAEADATSDRSGDATAAHPSAPAASPEDLFNSAYTDYSRGNFELALAGFEAALRADPFGPRADDAQLWIGETLFEMERYADAVTAFERVIETYPDSDLVLRARLKKGLALFEARSTAEAVQVLQALINEYPDSDEARIAEQYLKRRGVEFE